MRSMVEMLSGRPTVSLVIHRSQLIYSYTLNKFQFFKLIFNSCTVAYEILVLLSFGFGLYFEFQT